MGLRYSMPFTGAGRQRMPCCRRSTCWSSTARTRAKLDRLLDGATAGIVFNERTEIEGALVFGQACKMGLEGIVSKRLTAPYRSFAKAL
jgi:hypothetical protein